MLFPRRRCDLGILTRDQFDGGAAQLQIGEVHGHAEARLLDMVARFYLESEDFGVKPFRPVRVGGDDLDMIDALEHNPPGISRLSMKACRARHVEGQVLLVGPIRGRYAAASPT